MAVPSTPSESGHVTATEFVRVIEENERLRAELDELRALVADVEAEAAKTEQERDEARAEVVRLQPIERRALEWADPDGASSKDERRVAHHILHGIARDD